MSAEAFSAPSALTPEDEVLDANDGALSAATLAAAEGTGPAKRAGKAEKSDKAEKHTPMMQHYQGVNH